MVLPPPPPPVLPDPELEPESLLLQADASAPGTAASAAAPARPRSAERRLRRFEEIESDMVPLRAATIKQIRTISTITRRRSSNDRISTPCRRADMRRILAGLITATLLCGMSTVLSGSP